MKKKELQLLKEAVERLVQSRKPTPKKIQSNPSKENAKSRVAPKEDIATKARDLASKIWGSEKEHEADWLKVDLPKTQSYPVNLFKKEQQKH